MIELRPQFPVNRAFGFGDLASPRLSLRFIVWCSAGGGHGGDKATAVRNFDFVDFWIGVVRAETGHGFLLWYSDVCVGKGGCSERTVQAVADEERERTAECLLCY